MVLRYLLEASGGLAMSRKARQCLGGTRPVVGSPPYQVETAELADEGGPLYQARDEDLCRILKRPHLSF